MKKEINVTKENFYRKANNYSRLIAISKSIVFVIILLGALIYFYSISKKDIREVEFLRAVVLIHSIFIFFFSIGYFLNKKYITHLSLSLGKYLMEKRKFFKMLFYNPLEHKENGFVKKNILRQLCILIGVGAIMAFIFLYINFQAGLYGILYALSGYFLGLSLVLEIKPFFVLAKKSKG